MRVTVIKISKFVYGALSISLNTSQMKVFLSVYAIVTKILRIYFLPVLCNLYIIEKIFVERHTVYIVQESFIIKFKNIVICRPLLFVLFWPHISLHFS